MSILSSRENFYRAHNRAQWQDLIARIEGRSNDLLPFDVLANALQVYQQIPRTELEVIPLDKIVGSVGRYKDFTADFLPRSPELKTRWATIEEAMDSLEGLPPIEVYKIGGVYFVADGNHRVSVARANGFKDIDAYVTEIPVDAGLEPGDTLDQAIIKAERARFLAETGIDHCYPQVDIYFTRPGGFKQMLEHVQIHRRLMEQDNADGGEVSLQDAACDWYEHGYLPIVDAIRERQLLRRYPGRTAADLYVWIWGYVFEAYRLFGEKVTPEEGVEMLELRAESPWRQAVHAVMGRLAELSGGRLGPAQQVPDWVTQTFEWSDGSLEELSKTSGERHSG
jgi:hypothetical protein